MSEVDYLNTIRKFTLFLCLPYIKTCVLYIASNQEKSNKLLFKYDIDAIFDYIKFFFNFHKSLSSSRRLIGETSSAKILSHIILILRLQISNTLQLMVE